MHHSCAFNFDWEVYGLICRTMNFEYGLLKILPVQSKSPQIKQIAKFGVSLSVILTSQQSFPNRLKFLAYQGLLENNKMYVLIYSIRGNMI